MKVLRRVLLVDDDDTVRTIARIALELGELEVFDFRSASQALAALPEIQPEMILLDVMMPGMSGLEMLGRLRVQPAWATIPVVFLTARVMRADVADYLAQGATDVVVKPFDAVGLPRHLRDVYSAARAR